MKKLIIGTILATLLTGCSNQKEANKALTAMGFTDIQYTGYSWFSCSKDDFYHTGFVAKNAQGNSVSGTVCSGVFFKNSTVRF